MEIAAAKVLISAKGRSYSNAVPSLDKFLSLTLAVLFNVMREAARVTSSQCGILGKRVMKLAFLLVIHILAWFNSI